MTPKDRIIGYLKQRPHASGRELSDLLVVSRQAVNRHLMHLVRAGKVTKRGTTRGALYAMAATEEAVREQPEAALTFKRQYHLADLHEDEVFEQFALFLGLKGYLNKNVYRIVRYAFTEMLNNAIDHSMSDRCEISGDVGLDRCTFRVKDFGIGIFYSLFTKLGLHDEPEAVGELIKGKTTTMPERHSGEGIFFTSKSGDNVHFRSHKINLAFDNLKKDVFLREMKFVKGTEVSFSVGRRSKRSIEGIFQTFAPEEFDYRFEKTKVYVKLFAKEYVSRSEARRLLAGLEKFRHVTLDFKGVTSIGQAFADEIFRVFAGRHPDISIEVENVSPVLRPIIGHVVDNKN